MLTVALLVAIIIAAAIGVAGASMLENMRFARATDQIIALVAPARDLAAHDKNFAAQPGEDLLASLARARAVPNIVTTSQPAVMANAWQGSVHASVASSGVMRIESDVPAHDCRRLALFLAKNGGDSGLQLMEARQESAAQWQRLYDNTLPTAVNESQVQAACGQAPQQVTLAMAFRLR